MARFLVVLGMFGVMLAAAPVAADTLMMTGVGTAAGSGSSYVGPGDVVSGSTAWYSCTRGYNAAYSTGSNKGCNLRRASDNSTQDFNILANGNFDTASANTFGGQDAICNATISGTTMSVSSCLTGTLHVNDPVIGTGIPNPTIITAIGSCATPPGTCTISSSATVGTSEAVAAFGALFITEMYDQTGNSNHMTQATVAQQPQWLPNCISALPCQYFNRTNSQYLKNTTAASSSAQFSLSTVVERNGTTTSVNNTFNVGSGGYGLQFTTSANTAALSSGSGGPSATASDNAWHAISAAANSSSTSINVDGTTTTGSTISLSQFQPFGYGANGAAGNPLQGYLAEGGYWPSIFFTTTQYGNLHTNQSGYYGTP